MDKQNRPPPRPGQQSRGTNANNANANSRGAHTGGSEVNNANVNANAAAANSNNPDRRRKFANRARTASSGSTRGAFGPIPIVNSNKQHDQIYEMQQAAMNSNFRHINEPPVSHVNVDHNSSGGGGAAGGQHQRTQRRGSLSKPNRRGSYGKSSNQPFSEEDLIVQEADLARMADRMAQLDIEQGRARAGYANASPEGLPPTATTAGSNSGSNTSSPLRYSKRSPSPHGNTRFFLSHHDPNVNVNMMNVNMQQGQMQPSPLASPNYVISNPEIARFSNMAQQDVGVGGGMTVHQMNDAILRQAQLHQQQQQQLAQIQNQIPPGAQQKIMQDYGTNNNMPYQQQQQTQEDAIDGGSNGSFPYDDMEEPEDEGFIQYYIKQLLYDPDKPEFDTLQQMSWAFIIGVFMGFFTAFWSELVEYLCEYFWVDIPEYLLRKGIFTDMDGYLPLPHYMWICPAIWGGILSYVTALYEDNPIPGQNEWIDTLHRIGVMDHSKFFHMFFLATFGMASGLSLGPEMPLVVVAGMVGSFIALKTKQSVLSARVINLTAASAAIGGFFGFPMAGALFVLELPHRMGLQYFEALSPSVFASIIAVIVNKMVTGKDVNGYFDYPFLTDTLPNDVTFTAIVYGVYGTFVGILYADGVKGLKAWVHDWFHAPHDHHDDHGHGHEIAHDHDDGYGGEKAPLVQKGFDDDGHGYHFQPAPKKVGCWKRVTGCLGNFFGIKYEPHRAAAAGVLVGIVTGIICMLLPHQLFWGEAQLQTLIDRGRTPLPFFEREGETSILTYYGYCMVDPVEGGEGERRDEEFEGFSTACVGMLSLTKIITIGIGLGTGVCGGHFWGPLYVGCAASHFFTDIMTLIGNEYDSRMFTLIAEFPCVAMVCIMGCTHIVTYRCHMAIMLILTLTISTFNRGEGSGGGDYAAIFPLLVVACFVPMQLARNTNFYKQCSRGDIVAIPEVLCEPMQEGEIGDYVDYDSAYGSGSYDDNSYGLSEGDSRDDGDDDDDDDDDEDGNEGGEESDDGDISLGEEPSNAGHTRTKSTSSYDPLAVSQHSMRSISSLSRRQGSVRSIGGSTRPSLGRVRSFGNVTEPAPELLSQARAGAATNSSRSSTPVQDRDRPNLPPKGHRRKGSNMSMRSMGGMDSSRHSST